MQKTLGYEDIVREYNFQWESKKGKPGKGKRRRRKQQKYKDVRAHDVFQAFSPTKSSRESCMLNNGQEIFLIPAQCTRRGGAREWLSWYWNSKAYAC